MRLKYLKKRQKRYLYRRNFKKLTNNRKNQKNQKNLRVVLLSDNDQIDRILQDKIRITRIVVKNRIKFKRPDLINKFSEYLKVNKKFFNSSKASFIVDKFSEENQKCFFKKFKKNQKPLNFIFLYFQSFLKLMINEKKLTLTMDGIIRNSSVLNKIFQFKIKKLIILKLFLRY